MKKRHNRACKSHNDINEPVTVENVGVGGTNVRWVITFNLEVEQTRMLTHDANCKIFPNVAKADK